MSSGRIDDNVFRKIHVEHHVEQEVPDDPMFNALTEKEQDQYETMEEMFREALRKQDVSLLASVFDHIEIPMGWEKLLNSNRDGFWGITNPEIAKLMVARGATCPVYSESAIKMLPGLEDRPKERGKRTLQLAKCFRAFLDAVKIREEETKKMEKKAKEKEQIQEENVRDLLEEKFVDSKNIFDLKGLHNLILEYTDVKADTRSQLASKANREAFEHLIYLNSRQRMDAIKT